MADRTIEIRIMAVDKAGASLKGVGSQLRDVGHAVESATPSLSKFGTALVAGLGAAVGSAVIGAVTGIGRAIMGLGQQALGSYANLERLGMALESLVARELMRASKGTKDMTTALAEASPKAKELIGWIEQLAVQSPFGQEGVSAAFRTAMAYGFTTKEAQRLTTAMIDFASGSGASEQVMGQIAYALGQIKAKGNLAGGEIMQLTNAGLNVRDALLQAGTVAGLTAENFTKMQEKGLIPADKAIQAIVQTLEKDFGGAAKKQANTFSGLIESISDIKKIGLREFFTGTFKAIQPYLVQFTDLFSSGVLVERIRAVGDAVGVWLTAKLDALKELLPQIGAAFEEVRAWYSRTLAPIFTGIRTQLTAQVIPTIKTWLDWLGPKLRGAWTSLISVWDGRLRPALEAMWQQITNNVLPAVKAFITEGWEKLQGVWGSVKGWYDANLAQVLAGIYDYLENKVLPKLKEWAEWASNKISDAWTAIGTAWGTYLRPALVGLWIWLADRVLPHLQEWADWAWDKISAAWTGIQAAWNDTLKKALEELVTKIEDALTKGVEWVKQLAEDFPEAFGKVKASYEADLKPVLIDMIEKMGIVHQQYMVPWANFLTTDFPAGLTILGGALQANVLDKLTILSGLLPDVGNKTTILAAAWDGLSTYIAALNPGLALGLGLFTLITDKLTMLWQYTIVGLTTAFAVLGMSIDAFVERFAALTTWADKVVSALEELPGKVANWADKLVSQFEKIGGQIVDGIKAGIQKGWDSFKAWFVQKVQGIIHQIMQDLGIHSPSTVFAEIGFNMVAGLQQGWDAGMAAFTAQVGRGLSMGVPSLSLASGGGRGSSTAYNSVGGDTYNVSVNDQTSAALLMAMVDERRRNRLYASMGVGV